MTVSLYHDAIGDILPDVEVEQITCSQRVHNARLENSQAL